MNKINDYAKLAIEILEYQIESLGYKPVVHFELEGSYSTSKSLDGKISNGLNYEAINQTLRKLNIQGKLKPEYWRNQWEYVSEYEHQSPLKVASDLDTVIRFLPELLKQFGADEVFITPVVWGGDQGRLASESDTLISADKDLVHIPNAVHINISANDSSGGNAIPTNGLGEQLQRCLLHTSYVCCLLFLPEEAAFDRLKLKQRYGLDRELSSPHDLSGGHQGSVALYKQYDKHNQKIGIVPLLYDDKQHIVLKAQKWRPLSRIEHRLGASSKYFNPYTNLVFALANLSDALLCNDNNNSDLRPMLKRGSEIKALPESLFGTNDGPGAFEIFEQSRWYEEKINACVEFAKNAPSQDSYNRTPYKLGSLLKQEILASFGKCIIDG